MSNLHYYNVLVETRFGWCGATFCNDTIHRFHLPAHDRKRVEKTLCDDTISLFFKSLPSFQEKVKSYFEGEPVEFHDFTPQPPASQFYRNVYNALRMVPWGKTISYSELAEEAGYPGAARCVGTAMAKNNTPLIIPCHRVVKADRSVGGFSGFGGIDMKIKMLSLEGVSID